MKLTKDIDPLRCLTSLLSKDSLKQSSYSSSQLVRDPKGKHTAQAHVGHKIMGTEPFRDRNYGGVDRA